MELITVSKTVLNGAEVNSVNSRDLYNSLGLAKGQYSRWIQKNLIDQFLYNDDYVGVRQDVEGNEVVSYIVTLDTAKHLCMMAKTENAMKFRKYFIDVEKEATRPMTIQEQIAIIAKGNQIIDERLTLLERTKRLEAWQERALIDAKNKKVYSFNPSDAENTSKLHRAVWSHFKKRFNLPRYNELPSVKFEDGLSFINSIMLIDLI